MAVGIFLVELANGKSSPDAGRWVKDVDWLFRDGSALLFSTDRVEEAKQFSSNAEAMAFWRTETARGKPLTAFTVSIKPLP